MRPPTLLYFKVTLTIWDTLRFQMNFSCQPNFLSSLCLKIKSLSHAQLFATLWTIQSMEFSRPEYWNGSLFLLQGIIPTQGSNPGLPHCRWILYQLSHQGSPRLLDRLPIPSPGGLPNPGIEPESPTLQVDSLPAELPGKLSYTNIEKNKNN